MGRKWVSVLVNGFFCWLIVGHMSVNNYDDLSFEAACTRYEKKQINKYKEK